PRHEAPACSEWRLPGHGSRSRVDSSDTTYETFASLRPTPVGSCCRVRGRPRLRFDSLAHQFRRCDAVAHGILQGGQWRARHYFLPYEWDQQAYCIQRFNSRRASLAERGQDGFRLGVSKGMAHQRRKTPNLRVAPRAKRLLPRMVLTELERLESGRQILALRNPAFPEHDLRKHVSGIRRFERFPRQRRAAISRSRSGVRSTPDARRAGEVAEADARLAQALRGFQSPRPGGPGAGNEIGTRGHMSPV